MYIDAFHDRAKDRILVAERREGKRTFREFSVPYRLYHPDPQGDYTSVYGDKLRKFETNSAKSFYAEKEKLKERGLKLFESDCNLIFRLLSEQYDKSEVPDVHVAFFDIEVDFDPLVGFAMPEEPYAAVNAITVYLQWRDLLVTLAVPPEGMTEEEARDHLDGIDNCFVFANEKELLDSFLVLIEDADILSGWNSTGFDIPYLVNRIRGEMGVAHTKRLCLWEREPKEKRYTKFKREQQTYELIGRQHLDYLDLYQKNTYHEIHSYKLDYVGQLEVGEQKVPYEGTLDQLYKQDFRKFVEYNRQDTMILGKMDAKLRFIELANTLAHTNGVVLQTTLGSVALIDQAILNEAHDRGLVVYDKEDKKADTRAAGAYVADPVTGLHDYVGAIDINSLYPSVIRALNMSPDTIYGQIKPVETNARLESEVAKGKSDTDAWHNMFGILEYNKVMEKSDDLITVNFEDPSIGEVKMPAKELYDIVFADDSTLCLSANGTLFRTDLTGIIPGLLSKWYAQRKEMQAKKKEADKALQSETDPESISVLKQESSFWGQRQLIRKILLNSLYGAILNVGSRYYDPRIGQSVTLTGRCITRHMLSKVNQVITGEYNHQGKSIIYGDTDSVEANTIIGTNVGEMTIEDAFLRGAIHHSRGKEWGEVTFDVATYDASAGHVIYKRPTHIYRHKVSKPRWRITDKAGHAVSVTDDHSVMILQDGRLVEKKPSLLTNDDHLITQTEITEIASTAQLDDFEDEYVYDVCFDEETPYFFANNILVHNSSYFSIAPLKDQEPYKSMQFDKETIVELYDAIAEEVNDSFPDMMMKSFHTDREHGEIIKAGRELVASKALYLKKKRYAALIYDLEGSRMDIDGKPGKLKAMGVETQRSDTPQYIQEFLQQILIKVLTDVPPDDICEFVRDFRMNRFRQLPPWHMGRPTSVNGLASYEARDKKTVDMSGNGENVNIPGHVRAAMNWNKMLKMHNDRYSTPITDGMKVMVLDLKANQYGFSSVARPVDQEEHLLGDWFKQLPFDTATMEGKLIDEKIDNLIGILKWDVVSKSRQDNKFGKFFKF